jgi:hypothetical protein
MSDTNSRAFMGHICENNWSRTWRLLLAAFEWNEDAHNVICAELGNCDRCWRQVALTAVHLAGNGMALRAGSLDAAAENAARVVLEETAW